MFFVLASYTGWQESELSAMDFEDLLFYYDLIPEDKENGSKKIINSY